MTEISALISCWKIRSVSGVEIRVPRSRAIINRGAAAASMRQVLLTGIEMTSHLSITMIKSPQSSAIGAARIPLTPITLARANHIETAATPPVMRIAQPRLSNLARSLGTFFTISGMAPERVIRNRENSRLGASAAERSPVCLGAGVPPVCRERYRALLVRDAGQDAVDKGQQGPGSRTPPRRLRGTGRWCRSRNDVVHGERSLQPVAPQWRLLLLQVRPDRRP